MEILDQLNEQQKKAVTAGNGQILVLAGPGSGKTRVLTQRIVFLMKNMGIQPYNIMAVTFTNKAAREMQARVEDLLGTSIQGSMWLGTFHAVCARILRREASQLPFNNNFVIMDADDQDTLIKRIIKDLNLDEKTYRYGNVHNAISNAKNNLMFPPDVPRTNYREEALFRIYEKYQASLTESNAVDFDDLILWTYKLLNEHADVKERYGRRFQQILVDEFQDTNTAQYQLLRLLSDYHKNIFVVGDEDQSIYRWRGADYHNVLLFEKDFPQCQKILLEQNYRSTQTVLDAAQAVINHNSNRTPKNLFSDRGSGQKIVLYEADDDRMEARYVADKISDMIHSGEAKGSDFAVLYRTNSQSRLLEDAFLYKGMSYRLVGAQRFYGRREVKDMIAYLRVVYNPQDSISLARVINTPPRGVGERTLQNLNVSAGEAGKTAGEVLLDLGAKGPDSYYYPLMGRSALALADFGSRLIEWQKLINTSGSITALMDQIIKDTGMRAYVEADSDEDTDRWENVEELRKMAFDYEERGLAEFLQNLALVSDQDTMAENQDVPTLMTLHAVKGLEFNIVFIVGMDDGILPHSRAFDDPEEMAEERRLFYVGITRAKNRVFLVRANQRMSYGSIDAMIPSRFLANIPEDLINRESEDVQMRKGSSRLNSSSSSRWESHPSWSSHLGGSSRNNPQTEASVYTTPPPLTKTAEENKRKEPELQFKALDKVVHPLWGDGTVLESKREGSDEVLSVQFKSVGLKKLIASYSRLKKKS